MLDNGLVRYVEFEVHQDLKSLIWSRRSLRSVTSPLEAAGYQCYWMGRGKLTSLSGYYHPMYDQKTLGWSNIACVQRTDPWHSIVNSWSRGGLCESYGKEADKEALDAEVTRAREAYRDTRQDEAHQTEEGRAAMQAAKAVLKGGDETPPAAAERMGASALGRRGPPGD